MTKIKCLQCGDIIESDGFGKFVSCSCGKCYVDETPYYCRVGGDPKEYEVEVGDQWVLAIEYIDKQQKEQNEVSNN